MSYVKISERGTLAHFTFIKVWIQCYYGWLAVLAECLISVVHEGAQVVSDSLCCHKVRAVFLKLSVSS